MEDSVKEMKEWIEKLRQYDWQNCNTKEAMAILKKSNEVLEKVKKKTKNGK